MESIGRDWKWLDINQDESERATSTLVAEKSAHAARERVPWEKENLLPDFKC